MGAVRIAILFVAGIAAIGLFLVVQHMAGKKPPPAVVAQAAAAPRPTIQVLTAKKDLTIGTRITAADLDWQPFPADVINPAWITGGPTPAPGSAALRERVVKTAETVVGDNGPMQQALGAIVREPLLAGEPIVERKIVKGGQGGYMSVVLQPGMRAVAVPVNVESGAGGFILPGDRVDVLMSRKLEGAAASVGSVKIGDAGAPVAAETVLQNVRVLAIDQKVQPEKDAKTIVGAAATLEVPASDVELLIKARSAGELALALRSYADLGARIGPAAPTQEASQAVRLIRSGHVGEAYAR
jgi:pilus assembly protein CpaB